jgi:hypothetical protein
LLPARDVFIEDGAWGPTHAISDKEVVRALLAASAVARSPSTSRRCEATNNNNAARLLSLRVLQSPAST